MCMKTGENMAMWCGYIAFRPSNNNNNCTNPFKMKNQLNKYHIHAFSIAFDCDSVTVAVIMANLFLSLFRATHFQQQQKQQQCGLSTIKYFYLWLFHFDWNSISGTSKSMSMFFHCMCVCLLFPLQCFFSFHVQYSTAISNLMPLSGFCSNFFSIQQIACETNENVNTEHYSGCRSVSIQLLLRK